MTIITTNRINSIDLLRGVVMIIMALDHVRDFFHYEAFLFDPTDVTQTTPAIFFTRFITHFCAPVFVFLSGTSAYLVGVRKGKKVLSSWLFKRGIWLIIVELTIIKFGWLFKLDPQYYIFQVIWVLGAGMIALAGFIYVPKKLMIILSLVVIFGHNAFDFLNEKYADSIILAIVHMRTPFTIGSTVMQLAYPLIPWIFVMPLGYYLGSYFVKDVKPEVRATAFKNIGVTLIFIFIVLRTFTTYGDANEWVMYDSMSKTIMSFFALSKYPPSLLYLLITIGPSLIFLGYSEQWKGKFHEMFLLIGRVPMIFYIIHIYIIHAFAMLTAELTGFGAENMIIDIWVTMTPALKGYGFSLWVVYLIWVVLCIGLYPICKAYWKYKSSHRHQWWLSYL